MVPGGRERSQREEDLQRQVEDDSAQGPVVRAKKAPSAPSMDEWDGRLAAGTCRISRLVSVLCGWQRKERGSSAGAGVARDHGHPELHLDYCLHVFERPKTERHRSWLESFRRIVGWSLIPCRARVRNIGGPLVSS